MTADPKSDGAKAGEVAPAQVLFSHGGQAPGSVWGPGGSAPNLQGPRSGSGVCILAQVAVWGASSSTSCLGPGRVAPAMLPESVSPSCKFTLAPVFLCTQKAVGWAGQR